MYIYIHIHIQEEAKTKCMYVYTTCVSYAAYVTLAMVKSQTQFFTER